MGWSSARPGTLPQPLSMDHPQAIRKGRNSVLRVQKPAPGLGRLHATVPGICSTSWLCWWCVAQEGGLLPQPQPPTSPAIANEGRSRSDPDGLYQTRWWGSSHSVTWRHVRFLKLRPAGGVHLHSHTTSSGVGSRA